MQAQVGVKNSENYLKGKYTASCPTEILDKASMQQCQLCPFVVDPNNKSRASIKDFVMNFDTDKWQTAPTIKSWLTDIREGRREDRYGWMVKVG